MSADRTPTSVAVPEGGWRDGDEVVTREADVERLTYERRDGIWHLVGVSLTDDAIEWMNEHGMVSEQHLVAARPEPVVAPCGAEHPTNPTVVPCSLDVDHAPEDHLSTTGCAGSEVRWPVVAPLPTEAVEARRIIVQMLDSIDRGAHALVDRHLAPIANEFSPYGEDRAKFFAVHNAIGVAPSLKSAVAVIRDRLDRLDRLVPEDDEDTVRVPREAVERLVSAFRAWQHGSAHQALGQSVVNFLEAADAEFLP